METVPPDESSELIIGEHLGEDMRDPVRVHANNRLRANGENTLIDLGELGEHTVSDVRLRDTAKQGFLTAYIRTREYAGEHKVITVTASTIAIGAVLTGLAALKHRKK